MLNISQLITRKTISIFIAVCGYNLLYTTHNNNIIRFTPSFINEEKSK